MSSAGSDRGSRKATSSKRWRASTVRVHPLSTLASAPRPTERLHGFDFAGGIESLPHLRHIRGDAQDQGVLPPFNDAGDGSYVGVFLDLQRRRRAPETAATKSSLTAGCLITEAAGAEDAGAEALKSPGAMGRRRQEGLLFEETRGRGVEEAMLHPSPGTAYALGMTDGASDPAAAAAARALQVVNAARQQRVQELLRGNRYKAERIAQEAAEEVQRLGGDAAAAAARQELVLTSSPSLTRAPTLEASVAQSLQAKAKSWHDAFTRFPLEGDGTVKTEAFLANLQDIAASAAPRRGHGATGAGGRAGGASAAPFDEADLGRIARLVDPEGTGVVTFNRFARAFTDAAAEGAPSIGASATAPFATTIGPSVGASSRVYAGGYGGADSAAEAPQYGRSTQQKQRRGKGAGGGGGLPGAAGGGVGPVRALEDHMQHTATGLMASPKHAGRHPDASPPRRTGGAGGRGSWGEEEADGDAAGRADGEEEPAGPDALLIDLTTGKASHRKRPGATRVPPVVQGRDALAPSPLKRATALAQAVAERAGQLYGGNPSSLRRLFLQRVPHTRDGTASVAELTDALRQAGVQAARPEDVAALLQATSSGSGGSAGAWSATSRVSYDALARAVAAATSTPAAAQAAVSGAGFSGGAGGGFRSAIPGAQTLEIVPASPSASPSGGGVGGFNAGPGAAGGAAGAAPVAGMRMPAAGILGAANAAHLHPQMSSLRVLESMTDHDAAPSRLGPAAAVLEAQARAAEQAAAAAADASGAHQASSSHETRGGGPGAGGEGAGSDSTRDFYARMPAAGMPTALPGAPPIQYGRPSSAAGAGGAAGATVRAAGRSSGQWDVDASVNGSAAGWGMVTGGGNGASRGSITRAGGARPGRRHSISALEGRQAYGLGSPGASARRALARDPETVLTADALARIQTQLTFKDIRPSQLFLKSDRLRAGVLRHDDVAAGLTRLGVKTAPRDVERLLRVLDRSNSGLVPYTALLKVLFPADIHPATRAIPNGKEAAGTGGAAAPAVGGGGRGAAGAPSGVVSGVEGQGSAGPSWLDLPTLEDEAQVLRSGEDEGTGDGALARTAEARQRRHFNLFRAPPHLYGQLQARDIFGSPAPHLAPDEFNATTAAMQAGGREGGAAGGSASGDWGGLNSARSAGLATGGGTRTGRRASISAMDSRTLQQLERELYGSAHGPSGSSGSGSPGLGGAAGPGEGFPQPFGRRGSITGRSRGRGGQGAQALFAGAKANTVLRTVMDSLRLRGDARKVWLRLDADRKGVLGEADLAEGLAKCGISLGPQELRLLGDRLQGVTPSAADAGLATARGTEGGAGAGKGGKDGRDDRVFTYEQFARALKGDDPVPEQLFIPAAAGAAGGVALGGAWGVPVLEGGSGGGGGAGAMPAPYGGGFGGADGAGSTSMAVTMASPTAARTRADYGDPVVYKAGYRPHRYEPPLHATQGRSGQGLPRNQAHDSRGAYLSIINSGGGPAGAAASIEEARLQLELLDQMTKRSKTGAAGLRDVFAKLAGEHAEEALQAQAQQREASYVQRWQQQQRAQGRGGGEDEEGGAAVSAPAAAPAVGKGTGLLPTDPDTLARRFQQAGVPATKAQVQAFLRPVLQWQQQHRQHVDGHEEAEGTERGDGETGSVRTATTGADAAAAAAGEIPSVPLNYATFMQLARPRAYDPRAAAAAAAGTGVAGVTRAYDEGGVGLQLLGRSEAEGLGRYGDVPPGELDSALHPVTTADFARKTNASATGVDFASQKVLASPAHYRSAVAEAGRAPSSPGGRALAETHGRAGGAFPFSDRDQQQQQQVYGAGASAEEGGWGGMGGAVGDASGVPGLASYSYVDRSAAGLLPAGVDRKGRRVSQEWRAAQRDHVASLLHGSGVANGTPEQQRQWLGTSALREGGAEGGRPSMTELSGVEAQPERRRHGRRLSNAALGETQAAIASDPFVSASRAAAAWALMGPATAASTGAPGGYPVAHGGYSAAGGYSGRAGGAGAGRAGGAWGGGQTLGFGMSTMDEERRAGRSGKRRAASAEPRPYSSIAALAAGGVHAGGMRAGSVDEAGTHSSGGGYLSAADSFGLGHAGDASLPQQQPREGRLSRLALPAHVSTAGVLEGTGAFESARDRDGSTRHEEAAAEAEASRAARIAAGRDRERMGVLHPARATMVTAGVLSPQQTRALAEAARGGVVTAEGVAGHRRRHWQAGGAMARQWSEETGRALFEAPSYPRADAPDPAAAAEARARMRKYPHVYGPYAQAPPLGGAVAPAMPVAPAQSDAEAVREVAATKAQLAVREPPAGLASSHLSQQWQGQGYGQDTATAAAPSAAAAPAPPAPRGRAPGAAPPPPPRPPKATELAHDTTDELSHGPATREGAAGGPVARTAVPPQPPRGRQGRFASIERAPASAQSAPGQHAASRSASMPPAMGESRGGDRAAAPLQQQQQRAAVPQVSQPPSPAAAPASSADPSGDTYAFATRGSRRSMHPDAARKLFGSTVF